MQNNTAYAVKKGNTMKFIDSEQIIFIMTRTSWTTLTRKDWNMNDFILGDNCKVFGVRGKLHNIIVVYEEPQESTGRMSVG